MAVQIIAILCEGPHDVEFISRILKHNGYSSNDKLKIKDFPVPINGLLKTEASKTNVEDLNLQEVRQVLLPSSTLKIDSNYYQMLTNKSIFIYFLFQNQQQIEPILYQSKGVLINRK